MAQLNNTLITGDARVTGTIYGNVNGNAATATKLDSTHKIITNLDATSTSGGTSTDWSSDVNVPVAGTLPVANGGTGMTTATNKNAVVIGNSSTANYAMQTVRTASGAFYATAQDAKPAFGTLPVAQGGTGVTNGSTPLVINVSDTSLKWSTLTTAYTAHRPIYMETSATWESIYNIVQMPCTDVIVQNNTVTTFVFSFVVYKQISNTSYGDMVGFQWVYELTKGTGDSVVFGNGTAYPCSYATSASNYIAGGTIETSINERVRIVQSDIPNDLNDIKTPGLYALYLRGKADGSAEDGTGYNTANRPVNSSGSYTYGRTHMIVAKYTASSSGDNRSLVHQILVDDDSVFIRRNSNADSSGTWTSWKDITLWDGYKISVGTLSSDANTISFV